MPLLKILAVAASCLLFSFSHHHLGAEKVNYESNNDPTWEELVFQIEDSKSRVGIASVNLSVGALTHENGNLTGEYTIDVPLMQSKNDKGRIVLPLLDNTVSQLGEEGGILRGRAISEIEGNEPSLIVCKIIPKKDQAIVLAITTSKRTLNFQSRYKISSSNATQ